MTPAELHAMRLKNGVYAVPCDGCTLCCHSDAIRILPHEDPSRWQTQPHHRLAGQLMLAHKPNGDCIYLGDGGCTRQDDKPQMCYEMDCRLLAQALSIAQAKRVGLRIEVWKRGRELAALIE